MVPFTGSGLWQPEADKLALLREDIDHNSHRLKAVLQRPDMRREFFNGIPDDEKKELFLDVPSHHLVHINHCHGRKALPSNAFEQYSIRWAD